MRRATTRRSAAGEANAPAAVATLSSVSPLPPLSPVAPVPTPASPSSRSASAGSRSERAEEGDFAPSLLKNPVEADAIRRVLGEAGRYLKDNPDLTGPRAYIDLWNLFRHRSRTLELDDFGADEVAAKPWDALFDFLYRVWWRVTMTGVENIPIHGRVLLVANHSGVLPWDGAMIKRGITLTHPSHRRARMLVLDMFSTLPFLQPWLRHMGEVRACPENGERLLMRDELVGVFPEGVKGIGKYFSQRYRLARFGRGGFVRLALRTGAPIIPVSVVGAEEIHPAIARLDFIGRPLGLPYFPVTPTFPLLGPLGVVPLPTKWWVDIGKPIHMGYPPEMADRPMVVNELADKVRTTLQTMIDSRLARRKSVFGDD